MFVGFMRQTNGGKSPQIACSILRLSQQVMLTGTVCRWCNSSLPHQKMSAVAQSAEQRCMQMSRVFLLNASNRCEADSTAS